MDQSTHEIRLANWMQIINNCQNRPKEQTTKQWLAENQISEKQYYYWLRKVRKQAYADSKAMLPEVQKDHSPAAVSVFEIPAEITNEYSSTGTRAITIWTKKSTIEIPSDLPESLIVKLLKAVSHAL